MVKWLMEHCFKDKEKWFGKRYIHIEYDLFDVVSSTISILILVVFVFFTFIRYSEYNVFESLFWALFAIHTLFGWDYIFKLYNHFIKNKRKKD